MFLGILVRSTFLIGYNDAGGALRPKARIANDWSMVTWAESIPEALSHSARNVPATHRGRLDLCCNHHRNQN